ncbi:MAG: CpsB/CapC family capsule biosynthesis tyrosine phosphatase, partial [Bacteroidota bacterium]
LFNFLFKDNVKFTLRTDVHAHLLPDIDDGPKTMEASIDMIRALSEIGYKRLIATPHVYQEYYPNTRKIILEKLIAVQQAIEKAAIPVKIDAAAEYYLDDHFERLLKREELLTLDRTNYVLVECSMLEKTMKIREYLFQMQVQGYRPVLAHPERYLYYKETDYESLLDNGCKFQINLLSLAGHYGKSVQKRANFLLKKGWINFVGTDAHHLNHIKTVRSFLKSTKTAKLLSKQQLLNDTFSSISAPQPKEYKD